MPEKNEINILNVIKEKKVTVNPEFYAQRVVLSCLFKIIFFYL